MVCFFENKALQDFKPKAETINYQTKLGTLLSLPTIRQSPDAVGKQQDKSQQGDGVERMQGKH